MSAKLDDSDLAELAGLAESLGLLRLGAVDLGHPGFARARAALADYLARDAFGEMLFIPRTAAMRMDPKVMFPAARSALVAVVPHGGEPGPIARYAQSADYHTVVHRRLERLREAVEAKVPGIETLICVDTKPVLERSVAVLAGLGFLGKNGCLIVPGLGSYLLLGVLLTSAQWTGRDRAPAALKEPESAPWDACGSCRACLDQCPTDAFDEPGKLDPRRCISYLTIEHRGPIPEALATRMGPRLAGCDVCQEVCPYNRSGARAERFPAVALLGPPLGQPRVVDLPRLANVGNNQHRQFVKHTALNRIPRRAFRRNAILAIANTPGPASEDERRALELAALDPTPELAELARWAARRRGLEEPGAMRRRELMVLLLGLGACERGRDVRAQPDFKRESSPLGPLDGIPPELRSAFDERAHRPLPSHVPRDGEAPQTYAEFLAERPPRPQPGARTIAVLPIGEYPRGFVVEYDAVRLVRSPEPILIARFLETWFGLPTRILPSMSDELLERLPARELDGRRQLDAAAVLEWLRGRRPEDASCVLALTLEDLYADDAAWVFGYASVVERVGVHSMLRYDPGFADVTARAPEFEHVILTRTLRVLAHEVGHMFGLRHCVHFECLMNPTAGVEDLDRLPLHLCPVCLRKLWSVTGMSIVARWEQLVRLADELALPAEREWFAARLRALG